jgi:hypothetical protein
MTDREKLIELIADHCPHQEKRCIGCDPGKHYHPECKVEQFGKIADHLIANGVTFQQWIPVTERLPENDDDVLVYAWDIMLARYRTGDRKWHADWFPFGDGEVTHWMPLPTPPKGE